MEPRTLYLPFQLTRVACLAGTLRALSYQARLKPVPGKNQEVRALDYTIPDRNLLGMLGELAHFRIQNPKVLPEASGFLFSQVPRTKHDKLTFKDPFDGQTPKNQTVDVKCLGLTKKHFESGQAHRLEDSVSLDPGFLVKCYARTDPRKPEVYEFYAIDLSQRAMAGLTALTHDLFRVLILEGDQTLSRAERALEESKVFKMNPHVFDLEVQILRLGSCRPEDLVPDPQGSQVPQRISYSIPLKNLALPEEDLDLDLSVLTLEQKDGTGTGRDPEVCGSRAKGPVGKGQDRMPGKADKNQLGDPVP